VLLLSFSSTRRVETEPSFVFDPATPVVDENSLRRKEAVYTAAGRLARSLVENPSIPPDQFLAALAGEAKSSSPE